MTPDIQSVLSHMFSPMGDSEFVRDLEYQPTMDRAWHCWLQPEYKTQREMWERKHTEDKI